MEGTVGNVGKNAGELVIWVPLICIYLDLKNIIPNYLESTRGGQTYAGPI